MKRCTYLCCCKFVSGYLEFIENFGGRPRAPGVLRVAACCCEEVVGVFVISGTS